MALSYSLVRTVEPSEFVSLDLAKNHLRVDHNQDDQYISSLITAARETLEERTNRAFAQQQWQLGLNFWQSMMIIPRPPLISVEEIKYLDTDEQWQVVDTDVYRVAIAPMPGYVYLAPGQGWPDKLSAMESIAISFTCGGVVEKQATQFVLLMVGNWYENREAVAIGAAPHDLPQSADMLLQQLRVGCYP